MRLKITGFIDSCDIENVDNLQCHYCFYAGVDWQSVSKGCTFLSVIHVYIIIG